MENKKDKLVELNGLISTLAISCDTLLKNQTRLENKTKEVLECEEVGNLELSLKYKNQMKDVAEIMVYHKEQIRNLITKLDDLVNDLD